MAVFKKIKYLLKRHPLLYKVRFILLSKFATKDGINKLCHNDFNPISEIPKLFFEINDTIFPNNKIVLNDIEKVETIAVWMINNIKRGRGLGMSSEDTLKIMTTEKGGVCSDFALVFNNLSIINDIKVKEWGMKSLSDDSA